MLAARMFDRNTIRLEDIPVPEIGEGELLLQVKAAAICGTDVRMMQNGYPGIGPDSPRVLGHEFSGVIRKVGPGVTAYQVGERVAVAPNMGCGLCPACMRGDSHLCSAYQALGIHLDGGFAEYVRIPSSAVSRGNVMLLADHVSYAEGAVNEALSCVYNGSERCGIRPGDRVLVIGAGPIGVMHAMLAKMAGAGRVYINDLSEQRLALCKQIDPFFTTIQDDLQGTVRSETKGEGVDVCITACPVPAAQAAALEVCGMNGRINFFGGVPENRQPNPVNTNLIHYKQLMVSGTTRASLSQYRQTLSFLTDGILDIKPLIRSVYPLREIAQAFSAASSARGLKTVITMEERKEDDS